MPSAALRPIPPRFEERSAMRRCGRRRLFSSSGYFTMLSYPWEPLSFSIRQFERPPSGKSIWFLYRTPPFGLYWLSNSKILSSMRYLLDVNQSLYFSTAGRQRAQSPCTSLKVAWRFGSLASPIDKPQAVVMILRANPSPVASPC
jgi:hypothetical protein